jgi:hypothetical protein
MLDYGFDRGYGFGWGGGDILVGGGICCSWPSVDFISLSMNVISLQKPFVAVIVICVVNTRDNWK